MDFDKRLERAIERGQQARDAKGRELAEKGVSEEDLRNLHSKCRLELCDRIEQLHAAGALQDVIVLPIGFISDHMEVLFDLDTEARQVCEEIGVQMARAGTVGTDPRFVAMISSRWLLSLT